MPAGAWPKTVLSAGPQPRVYILSDFYFILQVLSFRAGPCDAALHCTVAMRWAWGFRPDAASALCSSYSNA